MLKAVLFDVDDTLIDWSRFEDDWTSHEIHHLRGVFDHLNTDLNGGLDDLEAYMTEFRNRAIAAWTNARTTMIAPHVGKVLMESAVALGVLADKLDQNTLLRHYGWRKIPGTYVFPDVPPTLRTLIEHGVKVGVVTNAFQPMVLREVEFEQHGILDYFPECRVSAADVGYLKPHPAIFELALKKIGAAPEETVFVGDDPEADVVGAQGMGMKAVLRRSPRRPLDEARIRPDAIVSDLYAILPLLDTWFPGWR
ncbi:MAG: HAD family hydrolase [bacterium]|nr:HAD family hydrolase [bacterium]